MSDVPALIPGFVHAKEVVDYAAKKLAQEKLSEADKWKRGFKIATVCAVAFFLLCLVLGGSLRLAMPLQRLIPILLWQDENGMSHAAVTPDNLDLDMHDASIKVWLWQYTMWRESYTYSLLDYAHHVVESMSSKQVAADYNDWIGAHSNPKSYQNIFGERCQVRVVLDNGYAGVTYIASTSTSPGKYMFRFWRRVECHGEPPQPSVEFTGEVDFIAGYRGSGLQWRDVLSFNPSRIVVVGYAAPRPVTSTGAAE